MIYCRNLYAIPGLDYVAHEDILPYSTSETNPLQHELFDKFLMYQEGREPPYVAQVGRNELLSSSGSSLTSWLTSGQVYE